MVSLGRARSGWLACFFLAMCATASLAAPMAQAAPLEGVTGAVEEVVAPVEEAAEGVAPPVEEATDAVPPAGEVTETVAPPVEEVTETGARPVEEATEKAGTTVKEAAEAGGTKSNETVHRAGAEVAEKTSGRTPATSGGGGAAAQTAERATHAVDRGTETVAHAPRTNTFSSKGGASAVTGGAATDRSGPAPDDGAIGSGPRDDTFEVPSSGGAVRAPFGKLVSYVWPAIALFSPIPTHFLESWGSRAMVALLIASRQSAFGDGSIGMGSSDGPVVAGVDASHGAGQGSSADSSLFTKIPSAIGHAFTPQVPLPGMVFYLVVALAVLAVFVAVLRELGYFEQHFTRRRRWR